jgi:hypothetical protein
MNNIHELEQTPMSSQQIEKCLRNLDLEVNIKTMAEISQMNSINEVLDNAGYAVLFTATNSADSGHWQCIFSNNGELFFFDSYGATPYKLIQKVNKDIPNNGYHQNYNLSELIKESKYFKSGKCFMNTVDYQEKAEQIATCGRHVVACLYARKVSLQNEGVFNFDIYNQCMIELKQEMNAQDYDDVVTELVK